ncbi:hypothetical protein K488DRAFT_84969 [Vararia minispora EC-137]|uniref:Uncharacterized protein n=1 Tax=Vararia minispora EC-137 TaxID=1314806 RepID=A0ACB8QP92_9AGAM|nr:hypothetical protein K488DRAFT_84969 [Vararia minispora EC-137]
MNKELYHESSTHRSPSVQFTSVLCVTIYGVCAEITDVVTRHRLSTVDPDALLLDSASKPTLWAELRDDRQKRSQAYFWEHWNPTAIKILDSEYTPILLKPLLRDLYLWGRRKWINSWDGDRTACYVSVLNLAVHLLWRVPRLHPFMQRHFVHDPQSGKWYTLVTTVFSHRHFIQLAGHTLGLLTFAHYASNWAIINELRETDKKLHEATSEFHVLALYLTAALASNLLSHITYARFLYPRFIKRLSSTYAADSPPKPPSWGPGSWGPGVYALAALTSERYSPATITFAFFPFAPIPTQYAGISYMCLDCLYAAFASRSLKDGLLGIALAAVYQVIGMNWWIAVRKMLVGMRTQTALASPKSQEPVQKKDPGTKTGGGSDEDKDE